MKHLLAELGLMLLLISSAWAQTTPPVAPVIPVTDTYFGIKVVDPYRYMENLADPRVRTWFKAQADFARATLDRIPQRGEILADIEKYVDASPSQVGDVSLRPSGRYFLLKTLAGQSIAKLYLRQGLDGQDQLLVDTDQFAGPHGEPPAINYYKPSMDGKFVAFGISQGGSELATLRVFDVDNRKLLPDAIDREEAGEVYWRPDNQSFFYNRLQTLAPGASKLEKYRDSRAFLHKLGDSPDKDIAVFGRGLWPDIAVSPDDWPVVATRAGSDYAIGLLEHGVKNEITLYAAPLATVGRGDTPWVKICDVDADVTDFAVKGEELFLFTHLNADRYELAQTTLSHPDIQHWEIIFPEGKGVLRGLAAASDALYLQELDAGVYHIVRFAYGGKPRRLELPFEGTASVVSAEPTLPGMVFRLSGWVRGTRFYQYDPATDQSQLTTLQPAGPYDNLDDLTSAEVMAPSYDGTMVPLSIAYKKGIPLDGTNPTELVGYGAYGLTLDPGFNPSNLAWLERGGILAVAHVRGGGEEGEAWHLAGYKLTKPNTWRDLIACAEYLINKKYTSSPYLGIEGGSAGGITIGRAITERPELFAAAMIRAGCVNALRMETDSNGPGNIPEFGTFTEQAGFEDLFTMDAYHHVRDGVHYPAVLLTTGMNDPRVPPWQPAKMAARLQAANGGDKPILLWTDYQGGHGIGASQKQRNELNADMYAFYLWQFAAHP
jgi:prolyl oligopeptidase